MRRRLAVAEAAAAEAALRGHGGREAGSSPADTAIHTVASGARASLHSEASGGGGSRAGTCRPVGELPSEDVTWGRTLTSRAPAARPDSVPPVDLSRLRLGPPVPARR